MSDNGKEKNKITLKEGDNVITNTKDVCNVLNEYFINAYIVTDMSEPDHIDIEGPLDDIISTYQNHSSINEMKRKHTHNKSW